MVRSRVWIGIPRPYDDHIEEDYQAAFRRTRCSRKDFAAGYRALALRVLTAEKALNDMADVLQEKLTPVRKRA